MKRASFYQKIGEKIVRCELCPHFCTIMENELGRCKARKNIDGVLYALSYEKPVAIHLDYVEKKPFYHFLPGTQSFSIGMAGCNLSCKHCQNWEISQKGPEEIPAPNIKSKDIIEKTLNYKCPSISYTYTEPLVSLEYIIEIAKLAKKQNIKNAIVSNGFINPEPLEKLCKYIDAANIDLKCINDMFYRDICGARLQPVLDTLKILKEKNVWIEITNLIIPALNDKSIEIKKLINWVKENLGKNIPLHFSAFYPCYNLADSPPTPLKTLQKARKLALKEGLYYVYTGNLPDAEGSTTYCKNCHKPLLKRQSYFGIIENNLISGKCKFCGSSIEGIWK